MGATIPEAAAWAILFSPLASFLFIALVVRPFLNRRYARLAGYVTVLAVGAALALSLWAAASTLRQGGPVGFAPHRWLTLGELEFRVGVLLDPLTAVMLVVVTGVSLMVQVYSQGYMRGDPGYARYFAFMSLFTASMVGIVLARSILQLYVFWELVGLCSYLLIGFWGDRPAAAAAAKKAFLVTRLGDVGFLLAILYLFSQRAVFLERGLNPLEIPDIHEVAALAKAGAVGGLAITWLALGIFAGAAGKSAQFPLHTWLPDAMEGPTPVSALIHAATMVAAGVFLVARLYPVFEASQDALVVVALVGGFTALFAATMGLVMDDIKRVMAYSTVSQLGYMMLALGIGAPRLAIFHLGMHAFFKALLFLGAGSVNHATGTFDLRSMGGLRRRMPWTYGTFLVAALSLAGVFPLAGFWSKDVILGAAWSSGEPVAPWVFWMVMVTVALTAFYIFRVFFMAFHGASRGSQAEASHGAGGHGGGPHESPAVMVLPMVALAVPAVAAGYVANPLSALGPVGAHWLNEFMASLGGEVAEPDVALAIASQVAALTGIAVAALLYQARARWLAPMGRGLAPLGRLLSRRYYLDELYEGITVGRLFYRGMARFTDWVDREVVDRTVDGIGWLGRNLGRSLLPLQNGQVQVYGVVISFGVLAIVGAYLLLR
ncbi:MAG: NADH-quinone oxidoreductase subunit L [Chloroflexi bacterium]|nr:NADH-quinone oxidoreductase subunit L [Chloroflexota bacterium]